MRKRILIVIMLLLGATFGVLWYVYTTFKGETDSTGHNNTVYDRHYALVLEDSTDEFWQSVYEGARQAGEESGSYVELFGKNLAVDYEIEQMIRIAIDAKVDGIIVSAEETDNFAKLIDEAENAGIAVVTLYTDSSMSSRQSYIGVNIYTLGQEYGNQIGKIAVSQPVKKVMVLANQEISEVRQNMLYSGIRDSLKAQGVDLDKIELSIRQISGASTFASEEEIRDIVMDSKNLPDVMICLSEDQTLSAYQSLVDFNLVGKVNLIGFYRTKAIEEAVRQGNIQSSIQIDTNEMGRCCVEALDEYLDTGYVSDVITVDYQVLTKEE